MKKIETLLRSKKTLFSSRDLAVYWNTPDRRKVTEYAKYYLKTGQLQSPFRGIYALSSEYSPFSLAQRIQPFSYISLFSALSYYGLSFQSYTEIHSVALLSKKIRTDTGIFSYHKIKENVFFNPLGIERQNGILIAARERTICDTLYLFPRIAIEYLSKVDTSLLCKIVGIYGNKHLEKRVFLLLETFDAR